MLKKDSLIQGTIILAAAALVARFLGLFQRVPLDYLFDSEADFYFGQANNIYLLLLVVATGGIPSAISKMISERYAQGKVDEAQQIYRAALLFGIVSGIIIALLLYIAAPLISSIAKIPGSEVAIRAIAPALFLFPVIAMMRGYFQGRQMMTAGGISQIVEQVLRVITGIGLALLFFSWGYDSRWLAAGATFGTVFGSVGAFLIMLWYARKLRIRDREALHDGRAAGVTKNTDAVQTDRMDIKLGGWITSESSQPKQQQPHKLKLQTIYSEILRMSVPIVLTAMTVQFLYMIDTMLFVRLTGAMYSIVEATQVAGWLGMRAQAVAGIPPILAIALSTSIIPVISSAYAVRNLGEVERQSSLVMRIVLFTGIPAALALTVASASVTGFIFDGMGGSGIVGALTAGTVFQITMMTTNSMLFGLGKPRIPMFNTIAGFAVKLLFSAVLGPFLGVYGLIIASTLCFLLITVLNLRAIRAEVPLNVLGGRWTRYVTVIIVTAGIGYGVDVLGRMLFAPLPDKLGFFLTAAAAGIVSLAVYLVLLILLRVITSEEAKNLPGPLRKLFGALFRRLPVRERQN
ncbi:polysaccharide biosynthesis protein [Paenibacillaceae bacterium]|nr:polysaccharide biosynthesis protein [Paenibacillaceae bacterium]